MSAGEGDRQKKEKAAFREMTAAHLRELPGAEFVEVMFLESARIYKVLKENPRYEEIVKTLSKAAARNLPVSVLLDLPHGDVIEDVEGAQHRGPQN